MNYSVLVAGELFYAAPTLEEAELVKKAMLTGNRWTNRSGKHVSISYLPGEPDPTPLQDKEFWWKAHIEVGYAGWDAEPLRHYRYDYESIYQNEKEAKTVYVRASSALDAIAKAKLILAIGDF